MKRSGSAGIWPQGEAPEAEAVLVQLDEVAAEGVEWLWADRIPMGRVTVLAGEGGVGKSLVALDIAARVSRGGPWPGARASQMPDSRLQIPEPGHTAADGARESQMPDSRLQSQEPDGRAGAASGGSGQSGIWNVESGMAGDVVLLTPEDDLAGTVRPRLEAAGADLGRVAEVRLAEATQVVPRRTFALAEHLAAVRHAVGMRGGVRLVVVDPVEAFVGRRRGDVAGVLAALAELAEETGAAVLAVARASERMAARAAWTVLADAEVSERRTLMPVKNTLVAGAAGLAFRLVDGSGVPKVAWEPGPLRRPGRAPERLTAAAAWLLEALEGGPLASREVGRRARGAGLSWASVSRAKRRLGVAHACSGFQRPWLWRLPRGRGQGPCGAQVSDSGKHWPTLGPDAADRAIRN